MSVSVYVAARWQDQRLAKNLSDALAVNGITINSTWTSEDPSNDDTFDGAQRQRRAQIDRDEIIYSDALVMLNNPERARAGTGGCHVETGMALALRKPVFLVGPRTNVFHWLGDVRQFDADDIDGLVKALKHFAAQKKDFPYE